MKDDNLKFCLMSIKDSVPQEKLILIKNRLEECDDSVAERIVLVKKHNPIIILILSVFLGVFGVDRFVLGDIGMGIAKLLLGFITFGIFPLVDIYFSYVRSKELNFQYIMNELA